MECKTETKSSIIDVWYINISIIYHTLKSQTIKKLKIGVELICVFVECTKDFTVSYGVHDHLLSLSSATLKIFFLICIFNFQSKFPWLTTWTPLILVQCALTLMNTWHSVQQHPIFPPSHSLLSRHRKCDVFETSSGRLWNKIDYLWLGSSDTCTTSMLSNVYMYYIADFVWI